MVKGEPQQEMPFDPTLVDFIPDELVYQFTEYDVDGANALLDDMGLTERDANGFRLRFDGEPFIVLLQYAPQAGPVQTHELVKGYWEAVGVQVQLKEVSSDLYRTESSQNRHDIATWRGSSNPTNVDVQGLTPPFGDFLSTRTGTLWAEWVDTDGASGVEPPADILSLWDLAHEWKTYSLGSAENSRVGGEIAKIYAENLISIGVIGSVPSPVYLNNRVGNGIEFPVKSYSYYWALTVRPVQWFINE